MSLYPMSFEEFILAIKGRQLHEVLKTTELDNLSSFKSQLSDLLRMYYFTGGMPEAVGAFADGRSTIDIRTIQNSILFSYEKDISKHAPRNITMRIHQVWESIPQQLAKENKRFKYGALKSGARAKDFEAAIQWLIDAGLAYKVNRVRKAGIPLMFHEDFNSFKLFMIDCGLMGALSDSPPEKILAGNAVFEECKGAFTEQYVFQQLKYQELAKDIRLFYFSADDSKQELDFLIQRGAELVPIEVKAEENLRAKSLRQFVLDHPESKAIRFSMSSYRKQDWMINMPLFAVFRI